MAKSYYNPEKSRLNYQLNKERIRAREAERRKDPMVRRKAQLAVARCRAEIKGLEFNISVEDLEWPEICPLLDIPLNYFADKNGPDSPSLDRKDSSEGYTKENTWVISNKANRIKNDATPEELRKIAERLL